MPGARRSEQERRIIYWAAVGCLDVEFVNAELSDIRCRPVPESTYHMNVLREGKLFSKHPELLEQFVSRPVPYGQWPEAWK